tara:strand:- start:1629 stop:3020 length:1392 start_codon:yes stop_codon:yes gene_type:complete
MRRLTFLFAFLFALGSRADAQSVLAEQVPPPFPVPAGEGLFRVGSAEPLGRGGFNIRMLSEAYQITVHEVGGGTSVTGQFAAGIGLTNNLDFTMSLPVMFDIAGGLTKYGSGDLVTSLKMGFPGRFPASFYSGLELAVAHPFGFKGEQALNIRSFSRQDREIAARLLFDINRETIGLRINLGYLAQSGIRNTGLMFGGGVEVGRGQIFTVTAEYSTEPNLLGGSTNRAVFGAHMNLWWLQLQAGIEQGFSRDLPDFSAIAGVRVHTSFGQKNRKAFGGRVRRVPVQKNIDTAVSVAVVNLQGFEHEGAGEAIANRIRTALTRHGHIRLVEVGGGTAFLDPDAAIRLAEQSSADIVITGRVLRYEMARDSRPNLPLVVGFPETQAEVHTDLRIVDTRENGEVLSAQLQGRGRKNRGVRLFPVSQDDRKSYLNVVERNRVWDQAIDQMVAGLLKEMVNNFDWFPG